MEDAGHYRNLVTKNAICNFCTCELKFSEADVTFSSLVSIMAASVRGAFRRTCGARLLHRFNMYASVSDVTYCRFISDLTFSTLLNNNNK